MRCLLGSILPSLILATLAPSGSAAQGIGVSARHDSWARFQAGAWKLVRVTTETLDDSGRVISTNVTETRTSLTRVDSDCVELEVEVGVEIAGKQFNGLPQCVKLGFHGELAGGDVKPRPPEAGEVTIEDRKYPCRSQSIEIAGSASETTINVQYSDALAPFILCRQSKTTDAASNVLSETQSKVVALDMPQRVLSETKNVACIKTVHKTPKATVTTLAMSSPDVPGGIVSQTTKEQDPAGRLVRRSTLELLSYGSRLEKERVGLFGRKRAARAARKAGAQPQDGTR